MVDFNLFDMLRMVTQHIQHRKTQMSHLTHLSHSGSLHRQKDSFFTYFWVILSVYWPTMAQMSQMTHLGFSVNIIYRWSICHISPNMTGDKIRSSAPSLMFYQKILTGVFVGAVFQRLTCRFFGHCLQTWTTRIILLHNLTSQEHQNSPDWCFGLNWIRCG